MMHDIPRVYTALAEWGACVLCILLSPKKMDRAHTVLACGAALLVQVAFLEATAGIVDLRWVLFMVIAVGFMFLLLYLCCRLPLENLGFSCIRAFLLAEFSASFEWQLYTFFCQRMGINPSKHNVVGLLFLLVCYSLIGGVMYLLERPYTQGAMVRTGTAELMAAFAIGVSVFALSNLSFLVTDTPFSGRTWEDIFYIRTLVDLVGVASLFAMFIQRIEGYTRYELSVSKTLLESQYQQYQISEDSINLINRKYHDLKHQISALRLEKDDARRGAWLDEMERDIRQYEAENKTGNAVLDILLTGRSLQCQRNHITMTCVADGTLMNFIDTMDLCAIVGNALDNAIESTSQVEDPEQRLIHMSLSAQRGFVLFHLENYFGGSLSFEDGLPLTTKADKDFHGFGVKSIRDTVERYGGSLTMEVDRGWFILKALFPRQESAGQNHQKQN